MRRFHRGQFLDQRLLADKLREGGQALHLQPHRLQAARDLRLFRLAQRRDRQKHPADLPFLGDLGDAGGREDRQARDLHALQRGVVIDEGNEVDALMAAQGRGQLRTGGAGAVDQHPAARDIALVDRGDPPEHQHPAGIGKQEERGPEDRQDTGRHRQAESPGQGRQRKAQIDREGPASGHRAPLIGVELDLRDTQPDRQARGDHDHVGQDRKQQAQRFHRCQRIGLGTEGGDHRQRNQHQIEQKQHVALLPTGQGFDEFQHSAYAPAPQIHIRHKNTHCPGNIPGSFRARKLEIQGSCRNCLGVK